MKRIEWLQWITVTGKPSKAHGFLITTEPLVAVAEAATGQPSPHARRATKSICRIFPHPGATALPADPDAERCVTCDDELRDRGKRDGRRARRKLRRAEGPVFQPKHTFEEWDR